MAKILPLLAKQSFAEQPGTPFERTFRQFAPYVAAIVVRVLGRDDDVEDTVQEVFLAAMSGLDQVRDPARVKGWLAAVTVRFCHKRLTRRRVARAIGLAEAWDPTWLMAAEASPEQRTLLHQVYAKLEKVPTAERLAWTLRSLQGEQLEEVARLCGCSLATAKRRIASAQSALEEVLSNETTV